MHMRMRRYAAVDEILEEEEEASEAVTMESVIQVKPFQVYFVMF